MNNMCFFNPFGSSGSGGGGGGGSTANYSVKAVTDSSGQVSYKLTKNGTAVGDVISFNGSNMLVNYGGELIVLNSAIAGIEEALDKTYNFTTFTELGISTQNKTLSQLSAELAAKNLEEGTVVTGRVYSEALPYNNYGNAEVLVNNSIFWWKTSSSTISPYSWNAIVVGNTVKMDWTPTYYQLPIASTQSLGGVKIGDNVQIAPDGTISVITTKGDTGTGIASIAKTSSSGLNDIYTITYTDSTTSTFTVTNGATITGGSIGQTGHLILTMSDGRTIDTGALPTDNEVEVTTTSSQPADPNVELWVDLSTQQTLDIPEINDSSTSSTQDTWSCKKIYDDQDRQETEIGVVANAGAKNLLNPLLACGYISQGTQYPITVGGVTFTLNDDGSITTTGSSTATRVLRIPITVPAGSYRATGCPSKGSSSSYRIDYRETDSETFIGEVDTGNGVTLTFDEDKTFDFCLRIAPNYSQSVTFKPMLRLASITDSTFVPYAKTNVELTVAEDEDRAALVEQVDEGAKNLLRITASSQVVGGVTFTVNADGTIIANGTKTNNDWLYLSTGNSLDAGTYVLSSGLASQSDMNLRLLITTADSLGSAIMSAEGTRQAHIRQLTSDYTGLYYAIRISSGTTVNNVVFKPMLCTAADWAISQKFVPYALSNPVITPALIAQVDGGAKNFLDTSVSTLKKYNTASSAVWNGSSYTQNGITYSVNSDGTISVSGTATSTSFLVLANRTYLNTKITRGKYSISGCPTGGGSSGATYRIFCLNPNANISNGYTDTGNGYIGEFYYDDSKDCNISIGIGKGCVITDPVIFKPILCTAEDYAISSAFVPYAPTNRELYETCETKVTMQQVYGDATEIPANSDLNNYNTPGTYFAIVANVSSMANTPYTATGLRLVVEKNTLSGTAVFQTLYPTSRSRLEFYRRVYEGGSWSPWYKFEGTAVT